MNSNTGLRVLYVGANYSWAYNEKSGLWFFNANNTASNANANIGSRHLADRAERGHPLAAWQKFCRQDGA